MKLVLRYGLICGLLLVVFTAAGHAVFGVDPRNFDRQEIYGYASMLLGLSVIFFAVHRYRERIGNGSLSFAKGLQVGVLTALISATIYFVYSMVYFRWVAPEFMSVYSEFYRDKISESNLPAAQISRQLAELDANMPLYLSPSFQSVVMFATVFLLGLAIALASAAILRRRR